jgi:hypothetical protein
VSSARTLFRATLKGATSAPAQSGLFVSTGERCQPNELRAADGVQAINAATMVSVGVGPIFVPSRSLASSMTVVTSRTAISVREWVGHLPRMRCVTVLFSLTLTMTLLC